MKQSVYYVSKALTHTFSEQPSLFPFLNSQVVQMYGKKYVKFKRVHGVCNLINLHTVVPHKDNPYEFVFFGRSNVGKSTLLNSLMQDDIAAVSKRPGKTKELMFCELQTPTKTYLVDAPGYGFATGVSKKEIGQWGKLISTYLMKTRPNSSRQQILCLLDLSHGLKETDALIFNMLRAMGRNFQIVFTKCDRLGQQDVQEGLRLAKIIQTEYQAMNFYVHFTSSLRNEGIDALRNHLMFQALNHQLV